jgi:hypothetical protein
MPEWWQRRGRQSTARSAHAGAREVPATDALELGEAGHDAPGDDVEHVLDHLPALAWVSRERQVALRGLAARQPADRGAAHREHVAAVPDRELADGEAVLDHVVPPRAPLGAARSR